MPGEESYFNAITAISGSGPAYHYLFMEAFADAVYESACRGSLR